MMLFLAHSFSCSLMLAP